MIRSLVLALARRLPRRDIVGNDGSRYLTRYRVLDLGTHRWCINLHQFHRGDYAGELHNHPWRWALSLLLIGGYREERRVGGDVQVWTYPPLSVNALSAGTFHRVDLLDGECWSLFITGPKTQSWGFWDRITGAFTPWREYVGRAARTGAA